MDVTSSDGSAANPFLLKLFYRTGAFHRPDEFATPQHLACVPVYALPSYTLNDLTHHLAAAQGPAVLPSPSIGTRIAFRHVYENTRHATDGTGSGTGRLEGFEGTSNAPRFIIKDIGSVVIGGGGPGAPATSLDAIDDYIIPDELVDQGYDYEQPPPTRNGGGDDDGNKTLADVRCAPGEYLSCAILPPLTNGCVAPASSARSGRGSGIGEAPASRMPPPPPSGASAARSMDSRFGRRGRDGYGGSFNYGVPTGGWRRGDAIPDEGAWVRDGGRGGSGMGRRDRGRRRDSRGERDNRW